MDGVPTPTLKDVDEKAVPSLTVSVISADPCWPAAGVTVTVRLVLPVPGTTAKMILLFGTRPVSDELAVTVR